LHVFSLAVHCLPPSPLQLLIFPLYEPNDEKYFI